MYKYVLEIKVYIYVDYTGNLYFFIHNRRTGVMRSSGAKHHEHSLHKHNPMKHKRKPPRGMYLNKEDIQAMVSGPAGQPEALVKALDTELVTLKRAVSSRKVQT